MRNEILFNTFFQCTHMSINPDKCKIQMYTKYIYMDVYAYIFNATLARRKPQSKTSHK